MSKTITTGAARSRWRRGPLVGGLVAMALLAAACGGGGGGQAPASSAGAPSAGQDQTPADVVSLTATPENSPQPQGKPGAGKPNVTLGSKNFAEQTVLGELYTQALQAKGYTVTQKASIGASELIDKSLQSNQIQIYPEYLGEVVTSVAKQPEPSSASDTYNKAKAFLESQRGSTLLKQTRFEDVDTIAVKKELADQYQMVNVADLAKVGPGGQGIKIAGPVDFSTRQTGLLGMKSKYNLPNVTYLTTQAGSQYAALDQGASQAVNAFSTDYELTSGKYTTLKDPEGVFGYQYVAPIVKQDVLQAQGPEFAATLNWVSGLLSTDAILSMNQQVQGNGADAAAVAKQFLAANGLQQ